MDRLRFPVDKSYSLRKVTNIITHVVPLILSIQQYLSYSSPAQTDPYRCQALLHDGAWSPATSDDSRQSEPPKCRTVEYSKDGNPLQHCLHGKRIVFAGDSTMRQVYLAAVDRLHSQVPTTTQNIPPGNELHHDLSQEAEGIQFDFIWDPWLNSSSLHLILETSNASSWPESEGIYTRNDEKPVAAILLGAPGLWAAQHSGDNYRQVFERGIDNIEPYISTNLDESIPIYDYTVTQILLAPVPVPEYDHLSLNRSTTITPERIEDMNSYLAALPLDQNSHILWVYNQISADEPSYARDQDGLHGSKELAALKLDIVLNVRCNTVSSAHIRSFKGSCCVATTGNRYTLFFILACASWLMISVSLFKCFYPLTTKRFSLRQIEASRALRIILFTLAWCWYCDGLQYIGRTERHYQQGKFIRACLFWLACCMVWTEKRDEPQDDQPPLGSRFISKESTSAPDNSRESSPVWSDGMSDATSNGEVEARRMREPPGYRGLGYLSRDHSDEIKGMMQGLILLYHYSDASQTLWVYKIIRLFTSVYFYLSGYGNTLYLLRTEDFSLLRIAQVLFRLNLLSALLPYMMGTTYDLYYFTSVITFWNLVTFAVVAFARCKNHNPKIFVTKVIAAALATEWLTSRSDLFQAFAKIAKTVFCVTIDAEELRFHLRLDRYVVYVGIVIAYYVYSASSWRDHSSRWRRVLFMLPSDIYRVYGGNCGMGVVVYFLLTQTIPGLADKHSYNATHPFISWYPILWFVAIRNTPYAMLREHYLRLPAALGRVALETYVLQHHIWLGRDGTALLTLGLGEKYGFWGRYAETLLFGAVFFCTAVLAHHATNLLARRLTVRRFLYMGLGLWLANMFYR